MKAIALISGGLDSILAVRLIQKQGVTVVPLKFKIPFLHSNKEKTCDNPEAGLRTVDLSDDFLKMLKNPEHGYGANINPCIDCKILMLRKAKELMPQFGARFIVTGEVLGQRPMSQNKQALDTIAKRSELEGLVVRPLSAKLLPETVPEKEGWIKRQNLLDFNGRSRRPQMELAKAFGIKDYAQPAGGCLLTDPEFTKRLKDLITHQDLNMQNVGLLKIGRHFRLTSKAKLVVGRNEGENERLVKFTQDEDYLFLPNEELAGPTALGRGIFNEELIRLSCSITCSYCDLNGANNARIVYKKIPGEEEKMLNVSAIKEKELQDFRI